MIQYFNHVNQQNKTNTIYKANNVSKVKIISVNADQHASQLLCIINAKKVYCD